MKVLVDYGTGTLDKHSFDKCLQEYTFTCETAIQIASKLQQTGFDSVCIIPEETGVLLMERVNRANSFLGNLIYNYN